MAASQHGLDNSSNMTSVPPPDVRLGRPMWLDAAQDITYGSVAGAIGKYIEYPFDTIKVRLQSQPNHLPLKYTGPLDAFQQSVKADGFFGGLYRGVSAPVAGAAAENSCLFLFEGLGRHIVRWSGLAPQDQPLPLAALWFTGGFSGFFTSFVLTPIELVKCKIQVPATPQGQNPPPLRPLPVIADIYRHQGLRGFFHGGLGTVLRETGGCAVWFGVKETVSDMFYTHNAKSASTAEEKDLIRAKPLAYWQQFVAGTAAGAMYNFSFFPADTIKSRMQTAPIGKSVHEQKFWKEAVALWREHGVKGLYRGCGVTLARSPSSGAIFIVFDWLKRYMFPQGGAAPSGSSL